MTFLWQKQNLFIIYMPFVKFLYKSERLWLKVDKVDSKYYYGTVDNKPVDGKLKYGDRRRVAKDKILEYVK